MAIEIERKYLVKATGWKDAAKSARYRQGYLSTTKEQTVRVRTVEDKAYLTIKGTSTGCSRAEYEYEIPFADASEILNNICVKPLIEKIRYRVDYASQIWEIDEFLGDNQGLIIAEVELTSEDQKIELPNWVDKEVSGDARYFNSNLVKNPYKNWKLGQTYRLSPATKD